LKERFFGTLTKQKEVCKKQITLAVNLTTKPRESFDKQTENLSENVNFHENNTNF
jgi:hypothetical protein